MERLMGQRRQRCVVLRARAGSGKTSALLAWRQMLLKVGYDVAWLSLAADDNEWGRFCECLLAALAEVDPAITRDAAMLASPVDDQLAVERWTITLASGLASRQRPLMVMLDDAQHLTNPHVAWALQCMIQYAPEQLHFAFGTRTAPPFLPAQVVAQGLVSELGLQDLAFTEAESLAFLETQLGHIQRRDAESLHRMTEGWVAGLQLLALRLKAQHDAPHEFVRIDDPDAFSAYFESEVLRHMSPEDLDMLTRMSVCTSASASLCAALLGYPRAVAKTMTRLNRLDADTLFITQVNDHDRETWYRLHPLLREVLQARAHSLPLAEQRTLHEIAWHWFEQRGQLNDAVRHAVLAGNIDAAAALVETAAPELMASGELARLSALMRLLPAERINHSFGLRLHDAYLRLASPNRSAVVRTLAHFDAQAAAGKLNAWQRFSVSLLRASLAMWSDDIDTIERLEPDLRVAPEGIREHEQLLRDNLLAWMQMYRGRFAEARDTIERHANADGAPREHLIGRCLLAMSHALEGRLPLVEGILRPVLQEAEKLGSAYVGVACMAAAQLADALYELNETDALRQLLQSRIDIIERIGAPDTVLRTLILLAGSHWAAHRRLDCFACLDRLDDYAAAHALERLRAHMLGVRAKFYLFAGEFDLAEASLQQLDAVRERHADASHGHVFDIWLNAERAHVEFELHRNAFDAARERLKALVAACERGGRTRRVVALLLQLAIAERGCGRAEAAHASLLEALRLGHGLGLVRTLLDASPEVPAMLAPLQDSASLDPVLAFYVKRLLAMAPAAERAAPPPSPESSRRRPTGSGLAPLSERERDILELVALAMPNKKIARALNITPETVKWHLKNVFSKLGVNGRDEAAERLRDLKSNEPPSAGS